MYIPIFVMNRIPSDVYRVKNPKLEIKKSRSSGYMYVKNTASVLNKQDELMSPTTLPVNSSLATS